jgi:DNA-binding transcriptional LysR family regulator
MKPVKQNFDFRQIEAFCAVVEKGSFSKAAASIPLSQPTVSCHIMALERTLGTKLLDRSSSTIRPTAAGRVFYEDASRLLDMRRKSAERVTEVEGLVSGRLVIGGSTIPGTYILPPIVAHFRAEHPKISVTLKIGDSRQIIDLVLAGTTEAGMVGSEPKSRNIAREPFGHDELVVIFPPGHRFGKKPAWPVAAILAEPFIMREEGSATRQLLENALAAAGVDASALNVIGEFGSTEAVKEAVKSGLGISFVSSRAIRTELGCGALGSCRATGLHCRRTFYLIHHTRHSLSPAAKAFLAHTRRYEKA